MEAFFTVPGATNRLFTSVKDPGFGALGNGIANDTTPIQNALNSVSAAGGGVVFFPAGTYMVNGLTLTNNVHMVGQGREGTIIMLLANSNVDLLGGQQASIDITAAALSGPAGTLTNFSISNLSLDGNKANQTAGPSYCLRFYAYGVTLSNLIIRNGFSGGFLGDYHGPLNQLPNNCENIITRVKIHRNNGIGFQYGGCTDSQLDEIEVFQSGSHNIHLAPNATALQCTNIHSYSPALGVNALPWLIETSSCQFTNCEGEGSDTVEVVVLGNSNEWINGSVFGSAGQAVSGFQIGQTAGGTPYPSQVLVSGGLTTAVAPANCIILTRTNNCDGTHGSLWLVNDGGNFFEINSFNGAAGVAFTGTIAAKSFLILREDGSTPDGSATKGGGLFFRINSNRAINVNNRTSDVFNVDAFAGKVEIPNAFILRQYSDNYVTRSVELSGGTTFLLESTTTPDPGNNGTITTTGVGIAKVTPTAAETGIILQAGTGAGQEVTVINQSASFGITFATAATSHVALGAGLTIAALSKVTFKWDATAALWY